MSLCVVGPFCYASVFVVMEMIHNDERFAAAQMTPAGIAYDWIVLPVRRCF